MTRMRLFSLLVYMAAMTLYLFPAPLREIIEQLAPSLEQYNAWAYARRRQAPDYGVHDEVVDSARRMLDRIDALAFFAGEDP
jgi:hypothetical protein